jgi:hypothetical protein
MFKKFAYLPLALTLLVLSAPTGKALAQSSSTSDVTTGTDPVPHVTSDSLVVLRVVLAVLGVA